MLHRGWGQSEPVRGAGSPGLPRAEGHSEGASLPGSRAMVTSTVRESCSGSGLHRPQLVGWGHWGLSQEGLYLQKGVPSPSLSVRRAPEGPQYITGAGSGWAGVGLGVGKRLPWGLSVAPLWGGTG